MKRIRQTDCFKINFIFLKFLGTWRDRSISINCNVYSIMFVSTFIFLYDMIVTVNFVFLPPQMDVIIEELIFYTTELSVACKVLTFYIMRNKIFQLLDALDSEIFQPKTKHAQITVEKAMKFNKTYWKIVASVSIISNLVHVLSPFVFHVLFQVKLVSPVCSYALFSEEFKEKFIYPLYFYQSFGMHFQMLNNVNIDTFMLGLLIMVIAQLDILDDDLNNVTNERINDEEVNENPNTHAAKENKKDKDLTLKLNQCIVHFDEVNKFCILIQEVFSVVLFSQFSLASSVICVCLFRFTLPAPWQYYIFLMTYMTIMILQILVPCWFGTRVMEKSSLLALAAYKCDWTPRSRRFKSNLRLFVERANRPLSIVGGKMFPLSLTTFSSIMNSAYSFFTLLRHMQTRQNEMI